jgi:hypothetical protein
MPLYRLQTEEGACVLVKDAYSVLIKASVNPAALIFLSIASRLP